MNKTLLLTKSNLRKNRGTSVGLFLLMLIATCLIGVSLLIFFDAYPMASKEAERLNAGDGFITIQDGLEGFDDEKIEELIGNDTDRYFVYRNITYPQLSLSFGGGNTTGVVSVSDSSAFGREMNRFEVAYEDTSITENYIYLPYQFSTAGGFKTGDTFEYDNSGKTFSFKVRGFLNLAYGGCNNNGRFSLVVDDESYENIREEDLDTINIIYDLKDGVNNGEFSIRTSNEAIKVNPNAVLVGDQLDNVISNRTFIGLILAVSMLVLTTLIVAAVAMMLANSIGNYIKENMKTLGALKAIGYTGSNIKSSLVVWFLIIACIGSIAGIILSYVFMPFMAGLIVGQMGIPYQVSFNVLATVIPIAFVVLFTLIVTLINAAKISKIQPIVALREGVESHNFKRNHVDLTKSSLSLNMSLAMKTLFGNMKQNVITFFVVGFMIFACIISLLMYENFSRDPKMEIFATEVCAGVVVSDKEKEDEIREYVNSRNDITNIREMFYTYFYYNDEVKFFTYVVEDTSLMSNPNLCYEGRIPQFDNEVAVSGSFAKAYDYNVGDKIKIDYGDNSYEYLITGLIQTTNNNGREAILTYEGAGRVVDMDMMPSWFWFDLVDESTDLDKNVEATTKVIDEVKEKFDGHVVNTINFSELMSGSMSTFRGISTIMLVLMVAISVVVIALILFLLIKALVYNKRKDYGIYKALGYTSGSLMLQTALSFMPSIIVSIIVFSIVSYHVVNPYMSIYMRAFGLMQCNFDVPVIGVVAIGVGFAIVSFFLALLQTARIRKIEAYNMLVAE
ncbi:MAG: FtsX-like permease family protein [Clostridiales bacterium]|nr:FtsX-like permease family protein [Clostridiales bacterium]